MKKRTIAKLCLLIVVGILIIGIVIPYGIYNILAGKEVVQHALTVIGYTFGIVIIVLAVRLILSNKKPTELIRNILFYAMMSCFLTGYIVKGSRTNIILYGIVVALFIVLDITSFFLCRKRKRLIAKLEQRLETERAVTEMMRKAAKSPEEADRFVKTINNINHN